MVDRAREGHARQRPPAPDDEAAAHRQRLDAAAEHRDREGRRRRRREGRAAVRRRKLQGRLRWALHRGLLSPSTHPSRRETLPPYGYRETFVMMQYSTKIALALGLLTLGACAQGPAAQEEAAAG